MAQRLKGSARRLEVLVLGCALALSAILLAVAHFAGDPRWLAQHLPAATGGDAVLWQVQTTFLSVGFAGLTIAAQLFAEAPLAIGASRGRVLEYVGASWFVGVGLVANAVIALETIWLPSAIGVMFSTLFWFVLTVVLLVVSTVRMARLFGHPSMLDAVVRASLVGTVSDRLEDAARRYPDAATELSELVTSAWSFGSGTGSGATLRVPVPEAGRVIKAIRRRPVQQAVGALALRATQEAARTDKPADEYVVPPQVTLDIEPGQRTRAGASAFRVITLKELDDEVSRRLTRLLQSSIEFEPVGVVTPYEESDREIANLKDAVGTALRSGAFATAERALELLGDVVRDVWTTEIERPDTSRRASSTRGDWLYRSIGEVEQDALLSRRAADMFVGAAMSRAIDAPRTGSADYVEECLRSFKRLWSGALRRDPTEFETIPMRIVTCVQNLAAYSYPAAGDGGELQARGVWAMVDLVKLALDAKKPSAALLAAGELGRLFEFDRTTPGRASVRGGQLVLVAWIDYLVATDDERAPVDAALREALSPRGKRSELLDGRSVASREGESYIRWDWWEIEQTPSARVQALQLEHYVDRAMLAALASAAGPLPAAADQATAAEYSRLLNMLREPPRELNSQESQLQEALSAALAHWSSVEDERLERAPISESRVAALRASVRSAVADRQRLADEIPRVEDTPDTADVDLPILGMNFRVPRHYLVDGVFHQTYADPKDLGAMIGHGFVEGEEYKIVSELRALSGENLDASAEAISSAVRALGGDAKHNVLVTPYGGLDDFEQWYSVEFSEILGRVQHIESGVLDGEALLFDRRTTLVSHREPEEKPGLAPVEGTSIALGIFEDVADVDGPQVRIETGERFVLWPGTAPQVFRFGRNVSDNAGDDA